LKDAEEVLNEAKQATPQQPAIIVSDGLQAYPQAVEKTFRTLKNRNTKHLRCPSIRSHRINNNKVERLHGTIRERIKVMRGFKKDETALETLENYRTYYNFLRPHSSLEGKTPAQEAGIQIPLNQNNKWASFIRKTRN
jgi:transposase-like protein